jgi:hypothetical protein
VVEEWAYTGADGETQRTIDVYAYREIDRPTDGKGVWAAVALLIECKRPELPHVFFRSVSPRQKVPYPTIAGLPKRAQDIADKVGAAQSEFVKAGPPVCSSVSKVVRKGKGEVEVAEREMELSGTEAFNGIVLPLIAALEHMVWYWQPINSSTSYVAKIVIPLAVIDGPMVLCEGGPEDASLTLVPWVRLERDEIRKGSIANRPDRHRHLIDVLHRDYLQTIIEKKLMPFANDMAERISTTAQESPAKLGLK